MVDGVDVAPEGIDHMQRPVHPVHAEREQVVVRQQLDGADGESVDHLTR